jgi:hypothetical protein
MQARAMVARLGRSIEDMVRAVPRVNYRARRRDMFWNGARR